MSNILGIDPSTVEIGISVISRNKELKHVEVIQADRKKEMLDRVKELILEFNKRYSIFGDIDLVVMEKPASKLSFKTLFALALLCGGLYTIVLLNNPNVEIRLVAPVTVKKQVTGSGKAQKEDVMKAVENILGIKISNDNVADAIAIGLVGVNYVSN